MPNRLSLPPIKAVIMQDHTYLRPGDIVQIGDDFGRPILDVVESVQDDILIHRIGFDQPYYGNIYAGDNLITAQAQVDQAFHQAQSAKTTPKPEPTQPSVAAAAPVSTTSNAKSNAKVKSSPDDHYFTVLALKQLPANQITILLFDHQTRQTTWVKKQFTSPQSIRDFLHTFPTKQNARGAFDPHSRILQHLARVD